ncbi:MAG: transcriptional repressor [Verrucomicrobiae bacterium]|nr:transcriptional repressor [Verrucomicrobiae bacterium]
MNTLALGHAARTVQSITFASPMKSSGERFAWACEACRKAQVRLTPNRERMLAVLAEQRLPMSLEALAGTESLRGCCNVATVYRALMLFKEVEVTRQVSLPNRISYFVLNVPGESSHYLICRVCGAVKELGACCGFGEMERHISEQHGYQVMHHDLGFFGVCPACQKLPAKAPWTKVPVRR